ncbi:MAG: ROK family protein [Tepidisphaeraceae bacterium]
MISLGIDVGGTSVKLAALQDGNVLWTGQSGFYARPDATALKQALRDAAAGRVTRVDRAGLCVPGIMNDARTMVINSINVPGLNGLELTTLVQDGLGQGVPAPRICNDAVSCASDAAHMMGLKGRTVLIALGTGVGCAVLDDGVPLEVDGESPGHLGQCDVTVDNPPTIGPDGGAGGLEGYIGVPALRRMYGDDINPALARMSERDVPLQALARAIRIAHAIWRPHHVVLAGGVGTRLKPALPALRKLVETNLTRIARPDRTLDCAVDDFHAARGAARLSAR